MKKLAIRNTVAAVFVYLLFCFIAGAIVVMGELEGTKAVIAQAICIWIASVSVVLLYRLRKKSLSEIGFQKVKSGKWKEIYYAIPFVVISLSTLIAGINTDQLGLIPANIFLALAVGFSEEIYFRGIIFHSWKNHSTKSAVLISAILFGICHLMNVLKGAELGYTILQIVFALFYGIAFALLLSVTESLWPCIFLHFFHDLCAFMGNDMPDATEIILVTVWVAILLVYCILMRNRLKRRKATQILEA